MTIDIPAEPEAKLKALAKRLGLSEVECIRRGLALFDLLTEVEEEGGKVKVHHADGEVETLEVLQG